MGAFEKICRDIKSIKIQGATNVAKAGIKAYYLNPTISAKKKLISLRPTEPALVNALNRVDKMSEDEILNHFSESQEKINQIVSKLVNNKKVYTHCHSTNVTNALIYAKKQGLKFEVVNTETRPLYQGRLTAKEMYENGISVTTFIDSAMHQAINSSNIILLGSDAILTDGIINKVGSRLIAEEAARHRKPLYIVSDSWKYSPKNVKIEERDFQEVWEKAPRKIRVRNPAFEKIPRRYVRRIISEKGNLSYSDFLKKVRL